MILHLHIPRTGGSSIDAALSDAGSFYHFKSLDDFWRRLARDELRVKVITGHFNYGLHEYFQDWIYLICLRDPVSRVASLFRYFRANAAHRLHHLARDTTITDFYRRHRSATTQIDNGQLRLLSHYHLIGLPTFRRSHLEQAKAVLADHRTIVGVTDDIDGFLARIADRLDLPVTRAGHRNATRPEPLSQADVDAILAHNELDLELYDWARSRLS